LSVEQHPDQNRSDIVSCRLHRRNAGSVASLHLCSAGAGVRLLPHHSAIDGQARVPQFPCNVRHLPRHGLQHDYGECGNARQWRD